MIIRKETLEDVKYVDEIADTAFKDFDYKCSFIDVLRRSGNYLPDLSLVCENDDGMISGQIMFCEVEIGETKQVMLASLCVTSNMKNKGIGRALLAEGHRIANKLGYNYIIAFDSTGYLEKKAGYRTAGIYFGLISPDFENKFEYFKAFVLNNDFNSVYGFTYFPEELGLKNQIPKFSIHTAMTEEEYQNAVYKTRQRKRYFVCGFALIALIGAIIFGILRKNTVAFGVMILLIIILYQNTLKPLQFTKNHIANKKGKYGTAEFDFYSFLLDNEIISYSPIHNCVCRAFYKDFTYLYLKKIIFLFVMTKYVANT